MEHLKFTIMIRAPRDKVWKVLWEDVTYRKWTSAFCDGSYAISNWNQGSKIQFLGANGGGMYSIIETKVQNEKMVFRHQGEMKGGEEMPIDEKTRLWSGSVEAYDLEEYDDLTELTVTIELPPQDIQFFKDTFPKAFQIVKELAEAEK